jgi:hypothetical protein
MPAFYGSQYGALHSFLLSFLYVLSPFNHSIYPGPRIINNFLAMQPRKRILGTLLRERKSEVH